MIWKTRLSHSLGLEIVPIISICMHMLTSSPCSQPFYYIPYITSFHHPPDDDTCIGVEMLEVKKSTPQLKMVN